MPCAIRNTDIGKKIVITKRTGTWQIYLDEYLLNVDWTGTPNICSGLSWMNIGSVKPVDGIPIDIPGLADALETTTTITQSYQTTTQPTKTRIDIRTDKQRVTKTHQRMMYKQTQNKKKNKE